MPVEIPLTRGFVALVDECDAEHVLARKWWATSAPRGPVYAVCSRPGDEKRGRIWMHRFILDAPRDYVVDHRDGNGLNNCRDNLRFCSIFENAANRRQITRQTISGFKGVARRRDTGKFQAQIMCKKEKHYLGVFVTAEEAARAYDSAAAELFGEFALLNFPAAKNFPSTLTATSSSRPATGE